MCCFDALALQVSAISDGVFDNADWRQHSASASEGAGSAFHSSGVGAAQ